MLRAPTAIGRPPGRRHCGQPGHLELPRLDAMGLPGGGLQQGRRAGLVGAQEGRQLQRWAVSESGGCVASTAAAARRPGLASAQRRRRSWPSRRRHSTASPAAGGTGLGQASRRQGCSSTSAAAAASAAHASAAQATLQLGWQSQGHLGSGELLQRSRVQPQLRLARHGRQGYHLRHSTRCSGLGCMRPHQAWWRLHVRHWARETCTGLCRCEAQHKAARAQRAAREGLARVALCWKPSQVTEGLNSCTGDVPCAARQGTRAALSANAPPRWPTGQRTQARTATEVQAHAALPGSQDADKDAAAAGPWRRSAQIRDLRTGRAPPTWPA